jgi:hypothetical protein
MQASKGSFALKSFTANDLQSIVQLSKVSPDGRSGLCFNAIVLRIPLANLRSIRASIAAIVLSRASATAC